MRQRSPIAALLLLVSCRSAPEPPPPRTAPLPPPPASTPLGADLGTAYSTDQEPCISVAEGELAPGTQLTIVVPGDDKQIIAEATVRGLCHTATFGTDGRSYAISGGPPKPFVGIAIIGRPTVRLVGERIEVDVDRDGTVETLRRCTSSEGVHLTLWSGQSLRWHGYHYLGYDTEPTCTEAEAAP